MDTQRTTDPVGPDEDLDRELAAALAVEPSPQFLARVRVRIAAECGEPGWAGSSWSAPALSCLAWLRRCSGRERRLPGIVAATACAAALAAAVGATYLYQSGPSPFSSGPSKIAANLSLLLPGLVPGPLAIAASRREQPTPALQAAMRSNAEANRAASAYLLQRNYDAIAAEADTFARNFALVEEFWAARDAAGATDLARRASKAAADLRAAAVAKDHAAVAMAIAEMTAICGACHLRYREELGHNTYAIKL
jgi:hypothetical protein